MEQLSRNKRIAIFSLVVLSLTIVGLFFTGNLSFSGLKSDILNQSCTEKGQKNKLPQYTAFLTRRDQAQKTLDIASGEIAVLNNKIESNKNTITEKKSQIENKKSSIAELSAFIEISCKGRLVNSPRCKQKIQQRKDLTQDIRILNNDILTLQNTNNQLARKIQNYQRVITQQLQLITRFSLFINQYEACDRQLKTKPTLTSPLMSGEARISGEVLVSGEVSMSGEVTLIGKTLVSGEVIIPSELCISGEVRVPLYRLTVNQSFPAKAEIDGIDFDFAFGNPDTIKLTDFYVTEENNSQLLYKCSFQDNNQSQMRCLPILKSVVNSETRNYILSAKITSMTAPGSLKVYGANIAYNGGKVDSINQTTTVKINYDPKTSCLTPSITVFAPNGGEILRLSDYITDKWTTPENQKYNPVQTYYVPQGNTPKNPLDSNGYNTGGVAPSRNNPISNLSQTSTSEPNTLNIPEGEYKMKIFMYPEGINPDIMFSSDPMLYAIASDESDNSFKIVSGEKCPMFSPPEGGWCPDGGVEIPGGTDVNGCPLPPTCVSIGQCSTTHYDCNKGAPESQEESATEWTWACYIPEVGASSYVECSEKKPLCPQFMPPSGGWCDGGEIIPGGKDKNGCELPPTCKPDTISPIITSLTIPTISSTTRVPLTLLVNETPFSYLIIDAPTPKDGAMGAMPPPPLSTDTRWISGIPTSYNFSGIGSRTFFAWVKDLAENVSYPQVATVNIVTCPQFMPPPGGFCPNGVEIPGGTDSNGCPLPPKCETIVTI